MLAGLRSIQDFKVAFRSGAVMGLTVVGLGLLDISLWYLILEAFVESHGAKNGGYYHHYANFRNGASTRHFLRELVAVSIPKQPMWALTLSVNWRKYS